MWLEGLKEACTFVHVEMLRGLSRFPQWHAISLMSLEHCLSHSDSNADCLRGIYAVIKAVLQRPMPPYFILTLITEMRHLGVKRNPSCFLTVRMRQQSCSHQKFPSNIWTYLREYLILLPFYCCIDSVGKIYKQQSSKVEGDTIQGPTNPVHFMHRQHYMSGSCFAVGDSGLIVVKTVTFGEVFK